MIGRIRKVLSFETEAGALFVNASTGAREGALQEVSGVELHARLVCGNTQCAAAGRVNDSGIPRIVTIGVVESEVVIVAASDGELLISRRIDAFADDVRVREVERCANNRFEMTGGDEIGIHWRVMAGPDLNDVAEDIAISLAAEVEIAVIRQVDIGGGVGGGTIRQAEARRTFEQLVPHRHGQVAGEVLLTIGADPAQRDSKRISVDFGIPDVAVEAHGAAVQTVGAVVLRKCVGLAIECELAVGDAVGIATDQRSEVGTLLHVVVQVVEAQHHIVELAAAIRHGE